VVELDVDSTDLLLTTTKQVRRRLDLTRPVDRELVLECIRIAGHAPVAGNQERNRWVVIDDPGTKAAVAEIHRAAAGPELEAFAAHAEGRLARVAASAGHLVEHLAEVPILVVAVRLDRVGPDASPVELANFYGSIAPAIWSFQLAAHARGLGSAWTTVHLAHEREVGELLGIPATATQVALLPVAHVTGGGFTPAPRRPVEEVAYANRWKVPVDQAR